MNIFHSMNFCSAGINDIIPSFEGYINLSPFFKAFIGVIFEFIYMLITFAVQHDIRYLDIGYKPRGNKYFCLLQL